LGTEEIDDEPAVGGPAGGMAEVGPPVRLPGGWARGRGREDGRISGVGERVAECEDAGVARRAEPASGGLGGAGSGFCCNEKGKEKRKHHGEV